VACEPGPLWASLTQKPVDEVVELYEDASCLFRSDWPGEKQRAAVTAKRTGPMTTSTQVKGRSENFQPYSFNALSIRGARLRGQPSDSL
jgi:hypothetical protein